MTDFETTLNILRKCKRVGNCLEWKTYNGQRYPYLSIGGKHEKGNRFVLKLWSQQSGEGLLSLHTCDNMKCINPAHLYWGTARQNTLDSVVRKRHFNKIKTHCKNGHPLFGDHIRIPKAGQRKGKRICRLCEKIWKAKYALGTTQRTDNGDNK